MASNQERQDKNIERKKKEYEQKLKERYEHFPYNGSE